MVVVQSGKSDMELDKAKLNKNESIQFMILLNR